ncbi:hypothetical protein NQ317_002977 [Molorchus minor]|uniref:Uncharacterized protein n=1 Tax=Molorchus minor TaxID=1323400 RepID=A0ABQ9J6N2_9CUCU|nr:hypothetical protein NQ317_002977 [Molorchus minor]
MKIEEEEEDETDVKDNLFKNDGSFLEMFKKMQEQQQKAQQESEPSNEVKKPLAPAFGKRRGGKVLKTGMVQKVKVTNEDDNNAQDAWSVYMKEVRRYKEVCCDDDSKTRPLVFSLLVTMPVAIREEDLHTAPFDPVFPTPTRLVTVTKAT